MSTVTQITNLQFVARNSVFGELAVFVPSPDGATETGTNWTIENAPIVASFYQNGLRQASGFDYTLTGKTVTSPSWQPSDRILVDYQY